MMWVIETLLLGGLLFTSNLEHNSSLFLRSPQFTIFSKRRNQDQGNCHMRPNHIATEARKHFLCFMRISCATHQTNYQATWHTYDQDYYVSYPSFLVTGIISGKKMPVFGSRRAWLVLALKFTIECDATSSTFVSKPIQRLIDDIAFRFLHFFLFHFPLFEFLRYINLPRPEFTTGILRYFVEGKNK